MEMLENSIPLPIVVVNLPDATTIGKEDFLSRLKKILCGKNEWRTSQKVAELLGVDHVELNKYVFTRNEIVSKPSKTEGVFLYALASRVLEDKKEIKRPLVSEKDKYAVAKISVVSTILKEAMESYAISINDQSPEAFAMLVKARGLIDGALALYAASIKVDINKI